MVLTVVIDDDISPYCDDRGCHKAWPDGLPQGYKWDGRDPETGQRRIKLYCSAACAIRNGGNVALSRGGGAGTATSQSDL
jgi:hypothetical protein